MSSAVSRGTDPRLRPRRRRWPYVVVAVVVVVLAVGAVAADAALRAIAQQQIRTQLASAFGLDSAADVGVDLGPGSVLLQAARGRLDRVDVTVPRLAFGDLVGSADVRATAVPLDATKPVGTLRATYRIDEQHITALAANLSGVDLASVDLTGPEIVATADLTVLGASVPFGLGLETSVSNGQLVFTPSSIRVAGQTFSADALRASPIFGGVATALLQQQPLCLAQELPAALVLSSATVTDHQLVIGFQADGATLGGTDFTAKGTCS